MIPSSYPFWPDPFWPQWLFSLGAAATVVLARVAFGLFPGAGRSLVWRESLALPAFATLATMAALQQGANPAAAPLVAMALALAGFPRVAQAVACHILRK
jgi:hypothetical protein